MLLRYSMKVGYWNDLSVSKRYLRSQFTPSTDTSMLKTDRLAALCAEINGLGGDCREIDDGLAITATALHAGTWHAYADHRMAMAGAIVGLAVPGVEIDDIATTSKTLPEFPQLWADMLAGRE